MTVKEMKTCASYALCYLALLAVSVYYHLYFNLNNKLCSLVLKMHHSSIINFEVILH